MSYTDQVASQRKGVWRDVTRTITVVNKSTLVTNAQVQMMVRAVASQLWWHAAPAWGMTPTSVVFSLDESTAPPGSWVVGVLDDADQAGILGWHTEENGVIYGRVFAKPVFDNGGNAVTKPLSVASVLSHECLETFVDPSCNRYADRGDGVAVALEVGDPVESDSYPIKVDTTAVMVSNFVTAAWFDPQATHRFDYMGLCTAPFQLSKGGYAIQVKEGAVSSIFAEDYPAWRRETKQSPLSRTSRRTHIVMPTQTAPVHQKSKSWWGLLDRE